MPENQNPKPAAKTADITSLWNVADYDIKDTDIPKTVDNANLKLNESDEDFLPHVLFIDEV